MAVVHPLRTRGDAVTVEAAVVAFLDTLSRPEQAGTRRTYAAVLTQLLASPFGAGNPVAVLADPVVAEELCRWFRARWGAAAGATWNRNLAALRSACAYWRDQRWITGDPTAALHRAALAPNRARTRSRAAIADLLARPDIALRERTLWACRRRSPACPVG
ncbi:MAG: hypothetical protein ACRDTN_04615 [Mycobacterium sp.]